MYPVGVEFLIEGLGLETMTPAGYDSVIDRIAPAAQALARQGAHAIVLMGTSLSFYKGAAFNRSLADSIREATGLPCTTMSSAVVDALREAGARRLAVATAYNAEVNRRLGAFLAESGFDVLALEGLGLERIGEAGKVGPRDLEDFAARVFHAVPQSGALLISCGGFRTLELIAPLERRCGVPVVSSMPHALYAAARLAGFDEPPQKLNLRSPAAPAIVDEPHTGSPS